MNLFKFEVVESTQDKAFELLQHYDEVLVVAQKMLKGRGRYGNSWVAEIGGLYMSIGFRDKNLEFSKRLLIITPIAILDVLREYSIEASIKLPNDIYFDSKKICGILIEAKDKDVVLGIGLNVNQMEFPKDINATSMALVKNRIFDIDEISIKIYKNLKTIMNSDFDYILKIYNEKIQKTIVQFDYNGKLYKGNILGINRNFELLLDIGSFELFYIRNLVVI